MKNISVEQAVETLRHALMTDKEYYKSWKDNIAVCCKDAFIGDDCDLDISSNDAAEIFFTKINKL